ncbi:MAG: hypothetical protein WC998_09715 [Candidatus Paceibacterota bacterium]|jgi:hypothetical protein
MITLKIDVTKIDKSRLFVGKQGTYLDLVLIESPNDKYGNDYFVKQSISKEDADNGVKLPILGNGKLIGKKQAEPPSPSVDYAENSMLNKEQIQDDTPTDDGGLPFIITIFLAVGTLLPMLF